MPTDSWLQKAAEEIAGHEWISVGQARAIIQRHAPAQAKETEAIKVLESIAAWETQWPERDPAYGVRVLMEARMFLSELRKAPDSATEPTPPGEKA